MYPKGTHNFWEHYRSTLKNKELNFQLYDVIISFKSVSGRISKEFPHDFNPENRLNKISDLLRTDHLNEEEKSSPINLCHEFNDVFRCWW